MDATDPKIQRLFEVNVFSVMHSIQAAAKQFIKQGSGGKIINAARYVFGVSRQKSRRSSAEID
jgi:NAD(P)-dependent dehydrogenase (short-subunit alcohol dehydrogenase family)